MNELPISTYFFIRLDIISITQITNSKITRYYEGACGFFKPFYISGGVSQKLH